MPEIYFEVYCDKCGAGLNTNTRVRGVELSIDPCEACLAAAREEGYDEGFDEGYKQAEEENEDDDS